MRKRGWPIYQSMILAMEAQQVIGLRMLKLAMGGPAAAAEAKRMVEEKVSAAAETARLVAGGIARGDGATGSADAVRMLQRKVRANRKRLVSGK